MIINKSQLFILYKPKKCFKGQVPLFEAASISCSIRYQNDTCYYKNAGTKSLF